MILMCNIEPFKYNQTLYLVQDNGDIIHTVGTMELVSLYNFVPSYCHQNNITKVKLSGNKEYNTMIVNQIKNNEELYFSDYEPIEVEVI